MKEPIQNRNQLKFDMTVYHTDVYKGNEPMKVVGIRKDEVELEGDWSGGTNNTYGASWKSLNGILILRE